ncbi:Ino eighty subunit 5 [Nakaseomyces bracarensis]|uniref:Ino eighty subunit 5 n=1 Tax=Nakaseomyces bracarensis TaxID=273131 RepID=A0ABR4NW99_9SACH
MTEESERLALEKELRKLVARNDDMTKQELTTRKEFATFFRKKSSIIALLESIDPDCATMQEITENEPRKVSEKVLERVPKLQWYNDQIDLLLKASKEGRLEIPEDLNESYNMYRELALLPQDTRSSID